MSSKAISPQDFEKEMKFIIEDCETDYEISHMLMDKLMEETLISLGYEKGIEVFRNAYKWYA